ncbi:MAG: SRPBCC family protein [Ilumatobacteraceae bacterium]|jgi:carbon monoxide dehydrogenase subunit G
MDKLVNDFVVHRPIDQTWAVLTHVERIAPCLPGAQLEEVEGDVYRGVVKVKLGAISTAFKGQAKFVERDDEQHRAVLHGEGRDTGGKGNADAMITAKLESISESQTRCVVETDLRITGKVAQFGRGIMADVSKKLMAQFATNLNTMLDQEGDDQASPDQQAGDSAEPAAESAPTTAPAAEPAASDGASAPTVRKIEGPAAEPVELSGLAGTAVLKRLLPAVGGLVLLLLVLRRFRRR